MASTNGSASLACLRIGAVVFALMAVAQPILWGLSAARLARLMPVHGIVGQASLLVAVFTAVSAVLWHRAGGNKGLMLHAIGMAVLALVQIGLGEMELETVHISVGLLVLVGAVALATLAHRKPMAVVDAPGPTPAG